MLANCSKMRSLLFQQRVAERHGEDLRLGIRRVEPPGDMALTCRFMQKRAKRVGISGQKDRAVLDARPLTVSISTLDGIKPKAVQVVPQGEGQIGPVERRY